jgi:hypothetical protein
LLVIKKMQKRALHITFFYFLYLFSIQLTNAQTVTNNGLALRVDNGLTVSITGGFTNQTNGSLGTIDNAGGITLTGDWQNNSANLVFTTNTGQASFLGNAAQLIGGSNSTTFWDLIENNSFSSTALTLNKPISVNHQLTLTQGHIVTTSTNIITMNNASTVGIGSAISYIKGPMAYNVAAVGPTTINFPIGKPTSWRPEVLQAPLPLHILPNYLMCRLHHSVIRMRQVFQKFPISDIGISTEQVQLTFQVPLFNYTIVQQMERTMV